MSKPVSVRQLSDKLSVSEYPATSGNRGFWLWDDVQRMNLSMRAPTVEAALVEAVTYYQKRLTEMSKQHVELQAKVDGFLAQFRNNDEGDT
jgi:hypothetical protein